MQVQATRDSTGYGSMHGTLQDDSPAAFSTEAFEKSVSLVLVPDVVGSPHAIRPSDCKD